MDNDTSYHIPVLLNEVLKYLSPIEGGVYVDGTLGGGGHSEAILEKIGLKGKLVGIDQDKDAIKASKKRLGKYGERVILVNDNFVNIKEILFNLKFKQVDGFLLDLGVSSHQLETLERGFSFGQKSLGSSLDMRMNQDQQLSAYDVVNFYPEKKLREIFFELGEESFAPRISRQIVKERGLKWIVTAGDLIEVIKKAIPPDYRFSRDHGHWASKTFRAIRMEVNQELPVIEKVLPQILDCLKPEGRLVVISFHSLEDRIVKHQFYEWGQKELADILTPKPVIASIEERQNNPRSESAKLRAVKRC